MVARILKVAIGSLRDNGKSLEQQIGELESLNDRLDTLIQRMQDSWDGEACDAYIAGMQRYSMQAKKMVDVLKEFRKYAVKVADSAESKDKSLASVIYGAF